jgi:hypothetical protein
MHRRLLQQLGDQAGPAGLVAGAHAATAVAVEILVEGDMVAPVGVALEQLDLAEDRSSTISVPQEDALQAARDVACDLPQRQLLT